MPAPKTRDYFAELYVAGLFGDSGWSVYFPKRDVGFDFLATKPIDGEVVIRPVQVKGLYPTAAKTNKQVYGFKGELSAVHPLMVLALPFFTLGNPHAPDQLAFMPLDQCKMPASGGVRCVPARFASGRTHPRKDFLRYFGPAGLLLVEASNWGGGA